MNPQSLIAPLKYKSSSGAELYGRQHAQRKECLITLFFLVHCQRPYVCLIGSIFALCSLEWLPALTSVTHSYLCPLWSERGSVHSIAPFDVTLNADTAHPRLEVSEDGKSVNDTGVIRQVPNKEERFDSHIFVLAKEGYTSGRRYWEVDVGKRRNWMLGVASESVARKGTVTVSPKNGFWVIGLADGQEYWAHTDPWTRLTVSGRPQKIGIFLNISANKLSFYNVKKKLALYTFTNLGDSRLQRKFVPFFSTGSGVSVHSYPLIPPGNLKHG
uniref:B30.2/SPRY domain-containing protein n=1 Tax=Meleagris gallopavo TaxID=9103 RepID=G1NS96_MELGA